MEVKGVFLPKATKIFRNEVRNGLLTILNGCWVDAWQTTGVLPSNGNGGVLCSELLSARCWKWENFVLICDMRQSWGVWDFLRDGGQGPAPKPASPQSSALPGAEKFRRSKSQKKHCEICPAKYCFSKKSIFQRWHWRSICHSLKYEICRVGRPQTKFIASGKDPWLNSP